MGKWLVASCFCNMSLHGRVTSSGEVTKSVIRGRSLQGVSTVLEGVLICALVCGSSPLPYK